MQIINSSLVIPLSELYSEQDVSTSHQEQSDSKEHEPQWSKQAMSQSGSQQATGEDHESEEHFGSSIDNE